MRTAAMDDYFFNEIKSHPALQRDYYAVKSHLVPTIAPQLALPDPQSRRLHRDFGIFKIITQ